jgi:hypothetical protein
MWFGLFLALTISFCAVTGRGTVDSRDNQDWRTTERPRIRQ